MHLSIDVTVWNSRQISKYSLAQSWFMNIYINVTTWNYFEIVYQWPEVDLIILYQKLNNLQIMKFSIIYTHTYIYILRLYPLSKTSVKPMPVFKPPLKNPLKRGKRDYGYCKWLCQLYVTSLWNAGPRARSQNKCLGSSVSCKPDVRHLLMLHKMCLIFLQSNFLWFCHVDLNSIWVGKPVAGNKVTLSSSPNEDFFSWF